MPTQKRKKPPSSEPKTQKSSRNPKDASNSKEFKKARSKAEEYARNPEKAKNLVNEALKKARQKRSGPLGEAGKYLTALIRLVRAYTRGEYTDVPWETIILSIAAIIYFVSPLDLIPDFIPVAGYVDDAAVIAFVVASIKTDLDNFLTWETEQAEETEQGETEQDDQETESVNTDENDDEPSDGKSGEDTKDKTTIGKDAPNSHEQEKTDGNY